MPTILGVALYTALAFLGSMFDNFFAFAAQLVITKPSRHRRVLIAQALGVLSLIALASGLGSLLSPIPLRWFAVLCLAPFAYALHARRNHSTRGEHFPRGSVTTFANTLTLGGGCLAVWIPLFATRIFSRSLVGVIVLIVMEVLFLVGARGLVTKPNAVRWASEKTPKLMVGIYALLGVLILFESHVI